MSNLRPDDDGIQAQPGLVRPLLPASRSETPDQRLPVARRTDLFGMVIEGKPDFPVAGIVFVILATVLAVVAFAIQTPAFGFALAIPCFWLGVAFTVARPKRMRIEFTESGIDHSELGEPIGYDQVKEVFLRRPSTGPEEVCLLLDEGYVIVPENSQCSLDALCDFLETQPLGERTLPGVASVFETFLKQQLALHGKERIYVYRPSPTGPKPRQPTLGQRLFWSVLGVTICWAAVGFLGWRNYEVFPVLAGILFFVWILIGIVATVQRDPRRRWRKYQDATVIVGPDGLAMHQNPLTGELRWRELRKIRTKRSRFALGATGTTHAGVHLEVEGSTISIFDLYQWPSEHIADVISMYSNVPVDK